MRLIRFKTKGQGEVKAGMVEDSKVYELIGDIFGPYDRTSRVLGLDQVEILAPCLPGKVVATGLNYRDHARELNMKLPDEPLIFLKPSTSVIGPGQPVICPQVSRRVDYEAELALVIGRKAKDVGRDEAAGYILGYTCLNDVTARDIQNQEGQWTRAKCFDTFCPLGPAIETDLDPSDLAVEAFLNGVRKQGSRTSNLIFDLPTLIEFISGIMTLEPGDVIATGTPPGVGQISPGDRIEIRVQGVGSLINPVVSG